MNINNESESSSSNKSIVKDENKLEDSKTKYNADIDAGRETQRKIEFELKMQRIMSNSLDQDLSTIREKLVNSSEDKEELEKLYSDEVDYKLEVDSLVNKLDQELALKDSSTEEAQEEKKRVTEEAIESSNKKSKQ